jgi:hypothetical protein
VSRDRIEFGYAAGEDTLWCAKRVTTGNHMLCGRRKGWMPPVPYPFTPPNLCPDCARILKGGPGLRPVGDDQAEGTCPVCVGRAPLDEAGLIAGHRQWSWSDGTLVLTKTPCSGEGELPEVDG